MKRKLFLLGVLALIITGGIFWSCQKEELMNSEEGVMLKNGIVECCIMAYPSAEENLFNQTVTWANGKKSNTINISAYNDEANMYIKFSNTAEGMTIRYANPGIEVTQNNGPTIYESSEPGTFTLTVPHETDWACGDLITFSFHIQGIGGGNVIQTGVLSYILKEVCGCTEEFSYTENQDGSYTFTYIPAEDMTDAELVFTFPQSLLDQKALTGWTYNGQTMQTNMNLTACKSYSWTVYLTCKDQNNPQNKWTDFKVNDISKKGDLDNIKCN